MRFTQFGYPPGVYKKMPKQSHFYPLHNALLTQRQSHFTKRFTKSSLPYKILWTPGLNDTGAIRYNKTVEKKLLPKDEVVFIKSLSRPDSEARLRALWESGWSLSILGDSLDPKRPKTTVHFWVKPCSLHYPAPLYPRASSPQSDNLRPH